MTLFEQIVLAQQKKPITAISGYWFEIFHQVAESRYYELWSKIELPVETVVSIVVGDPIRTQIRENNDVF